MVCVSVPVAATAAAGASLLAPMAYSGMAGTAASAVGATGAGTAVAAGAATGAGTTSFLGLSATQLAAAGSLASGASSLVSGISGSMAARANAKVAAENAQLSQQKATQAAQAGEAQAGIQEQQTRAKAGALLAAQAASGVDVGSGSAPNVRASQAEVGMENALNIKTNAAMQAYGYQTQGVSYAAQAKADQTTSTMDLAGGVIGGTAGVASGLGKLGMANGWQTFSNKGQFTPGGTTF